jgi:hypothetical protein
MIYISISPDQRTSSTDEIDDASAVQAPLLCCLATTRQPHVPYNSATTNNNRRRWTHTGQQFPVATARLPSDYIIIY